jgi:hypothetical protein
LAARILVDLRQIVSRVGTRISFNWIIIENAYDLCHVGAPLGEEKRKRQAAIADEI